MLVARGTLVPLEHSPTSLYVGSVQTADAVRMVFTSLFVYSFYFRTWNPKRDLHSAVDVVLLNILAFK